MTGCNVLLIWAKFENKQLLKESKDDNLEQYRLSLGIEKKNIFRHWTREYIHSRLQNYKTFDGENLELMYEKQLAYLTKYKNSDFAINNRSSGMKRLTVRVNFSAEMNWEEIKVNFSIVLLNLSLEFMQVYFTINLPYNYIS